MGKKKHQKVIILNHGLHIAGVSRTLVNFANSLAAHGYDVIVKIEIDDFTLASELDPRVKRSLFFKEPHPFGLRVKGFLRFYAMWRDWLFRQSPKRQYRFVVRKKYDIEIAFNRGAAARIIAASNRKNTRKLAWVHTDYMNNESYLAGFSTEEEAVAAYRAFDSVICVSEQTKRSFIERFGDTENLRVCANICDRAGMMRAGDEEDIPKNGFTFLSVGRLSEQKNVKLLLETAAAIRDAGKNVYWWIVGDGECRKSLEQICADEGLNNVTFFGACSNPYPYFKAADVYVSTSLCEGLSTTTIEALFFGKPTVVIDCAGMKDILGESRYGCVVSPTEKAKLRDVLIRLSEDGEFREKWQNAAAERAEAFDPVVCFERIEREINGI